MSISQNEMAYVGALRFVYAGMVCLGIMLIPTAGFAQDAGKDAVKEIPMVAADQKSPRKAVKKKKNTPIVLPESQKDPAVLAPPAAAKNGDGNFAELSFNKTLVIEGKVEKPQVQFTLLKEPPPEKEIRFETSFMQNILKQDRENTFKVGETYGRE